LTVGPLGSKPEAEVVVRDSNRTLKPHREGAQRMLR
jgi:hypothetical protein